ncbi:MAG: hypothetical protein COV07_02640 [Candidatus Vogelbacteria bacterium CG10_big_fil_rev_8_21_14_0_10_45_14]|uniref:Aminoglycoside phosphotransferase domain-containing protein n=1 Tax=Candidatus Vogelbacteria bacterium CG10_big_fil_rev_8_21_14_0_10_45_14 TaxID=1975042 RepID=A0A2H0RJL7_9BACT|nr:MAG: hypothetical protein COV07_02640 [Candidatus Vogelbacteria bacterium CG10_big_fil_rev_8_21_14_0_10_45_14]
MSTTCMTNKTRKPEIKEGQLIEVVARDFGLNIRDVKSVQKGDSSRVFSAVSDGGEVFIRINRDREAYPTEIAGINLLRQSGIHCPEVLGYRENSAIGYPAMIERAVDGVLLDRFYDAVDNVDEAKINRIARNVGATLKKINDVVTNGYGWPILIEGKLVGKYESWASFWRSNDNLYYRTPDYLAQHKLVPKETITRIIEANDEIGEETVSSHFLHNDLHDGHVYIKDEAVLGVIDLGAIMFGDPRFDIAYLLYFTPPKYRQAFIEGYGSLASDPMINKYMLLIAARKIEYRHEGGFKDRLPDAFTGLEDALKNLSEC